jgi:hypothetical protein
MSKIKSKPSIGSAVIYNKEHKVQCTQGRLDS